MVVHRQKTKAADDTGGLYLIPSDDWITICDFSPPLRGQGPSSKWNYLFLAAAVHQALLVSCLLAPAGTSVLTIPDQTLSPPQSVFVGASPG